MNPSLYLRTALFCVSALSAPYAAADIARNDLVGNWYGEGNFSAEIKTKWVTTRLENGDLLVKYRYYKNDKVLSEVLSIGTWQVVGQRYVATYTSNNGKVEAKPQMHQYDLVSYDGTELEYRSIANERFPATLYRVKRVQVGFELP
jgi:hypothetical protein